MAAWNAVCEEDEQHLYLAGEHVKAGHYRELGARGREIILETDDVLPASLDGRVACYFHVSETWGQIVVAATRYKIRHESLAR